MRPSETKLSTPSRKNLLGKCQKKPLRPNSPHQLPAQSFLRGFPSLREAIGGFNGQRGSVFSLWSNDLRYLDVALFQWKSDRGASIL